MATDASKRSNASEIRRAHHHLSEQINRVYLMLSARNDRGGLVALLLVLRNELNEHFRLEEAGGYLDEVVSVAPRLSDRTEALLAEHPKFSKWIDVLISQAETGIATSDWWTKFEREARYFFEDLREHERAENCVVQEAYEDDVGNKD